MSNLVQIIDDDHTNKEKTTTLLKNYSKAPKPNKKITVTMKMITTETDLKANKSNTS